MALPPKKPRMTTSTPKLRSWKASRLGSMPWCSPWPPAWRARLRRRRRCWACGSAGGRSELGPAAGRRRSRPRPSEPGRDQRASCVTSVTRPSGRGPSRRPRARAPRRAAGQAGAFGGHGGLDPGARLGQGLLGLRLRGRSASPARAAGPRRARGRARRCRRGGPRPARPRPWPAGRRPRPPGAWPLPCSPRSGCRAPARTRRYGFQSSCVSRNMRQQEQAEVAGTPSRRRPAAAVRGASGAGRRFGERQVDGDEAA